MGPGLRARRPSLERLPGSRCDTCCRPALARRGFTRPERGRKERISGVSISVDHTCEFVRLRVDCTRREVLYLQPLGGGAIDLRRDRELMATIATAGVPDSGVFKTNFPSGLSCSRLGPRLADRAGSPTQPVPHRPRLRYQRGIGSQVEPGEPQPERVCARLLPRPPSSSLGLPNAAGGAGKSSNLCRQSIGLSRPSGKQHTSKGARSGTRGLRWEVAVPCGIGWLRGWRSPTTFT